MLYHAWYQMVLGAVAASEHAASEGAGGMGVAFIYLYIYIYIYMLSLIHI